MVQIVFIDYAYIMVEKKDSRHIESLSDVTSWAGIVPNVYYISCNENTVTSFSNISLLSSCTFNFFSGPKTDKPNS